MSAGSSPLTVVIRLVGVEIRKLFTTRSTRVFLIVIATAGAALAAAAGFAGEQTEVNAAALATVLGLVFTIAMPVLGVLIFTSDWQHREISVMFLAQPRRSRTFVAKLGATVTTAMLVLAASAAVAVVVAVGLGLLLGRPLTWTGLDESAPLLVSGSLVGVLVGAALGSALKNAIAAIALSFMQSLVIDPLLGFLPAGVGPYLMTSSISDFVTGAGSLWPFLTAALVWLALPFGIGFLRHRFDEVG